MVENLPSSGSQHSFNSSGRLGAQTFVFFLLCLVWTYNGAFLWIGTKLFPEIPALVETIAFIVLAGALFFGYIGLFLPIGRIIERNALVYLVAIVVFYIVMFGTGSIHLLDTSIISISAIVLALVAIAS